VVAAHSEMGCPFFFYETYPQTRKTVGPVTPSQRTQTLRLPVCRSKQAPHDPNPEPAEPSPRHPSRNPDAPGDPPKPRLLHRKQTPPSNAKKQLDRAKRKVV